jgi:hypothetical protein
MSETRISGGGSMSGGEIRELTGAQREAVDLIDLSDAGYKVFTQADLDHRFKPWLVSREDGTIWTLQHGLPLGGVNAQTHAVIMDDPSHWAFLVSAKASGRSDAPAHIGELEARAAKAEEDAKRQAAGRERTLRELPKQARPVTLGDLYFEDHGMRLTLAQAGRRITDAGGRVELNKRGELVVALPPSAYAYGAEPVKAARLIYCAHAVVADCLRSGKELPDREVLPNGALA